MAKFRIGLFTSAWDEVAWKLISTVHQAIRIGFIPNTEIVFLLCTREKGETTFGDLIIENAWKEGLPIKVFSSIHFKPDMRSLGRKKKEKDNDTSILDTWRDEHDIEIAKRISLTDLDVFLGYMWEVGEKMCGERKIINLHPALPGGPKGTYKDVIWELIETQATETGVMMHLIIPQVDEDPPISFCQFPIRGNMFDPLWQEMEERFKRESLNEIRKREGDDNSLFKMIRSEGVKREFPMVIGAIKKVVEGSIQINNGQVLDANGQVLTKGYDLTQEINEAIYQ